VAFYSLLWSASEGADICPITRVAYLQFTVVDHT
jgi:hypothetical protein